MPVRCKTMSTSTQCPQCDTRFRVSQEQLEAHQGMVRCGRCQAIFNAMQYLDDGQPSPQLSLPIAPEETRQTATESTPVTQKNFNLNNTSQVCAEKTDKTEPAEPTTLAQRIAFVNIPDTPPPKPAKKSFGWPWLAGCMLLLAVLLAQAAYFFRTELAASLPGIKPALIAYCGLLQCAVSLPQKAELVSIESSELEADQTQANIITLNAILHNRAPFTQAYPNFELTLTDMQDKALARRTIRPAEYLKPEEDEKQGLPAYREYSFKLRLDTTDLKPSGYRLLLFYAVEDRIPRL